MSGFLNTEVEFLRSPIYRTVLKNITEEIDYDYNIEIVELKILIGHIHMVVGSEPKISRSDIMQIIKNISAKQFFRL